MMLTMVSLFNGEIVPNKELMLAFCKCQLLTAAIKEFGIQSECADELERNLCDLLDLVAAWNEATRIISRLKRVVMVVDKFK